MKTAAVHVQFISQVMDMAWCYNCVLPQIGHCHFNRLRLSLYNSGPDPISGSRYISLADSAVITFLLYFPTIFYGEQFHLGQVQGDLTKLVSFSYV